MGLYKKLRRLSLNKMMNTKKFIIIGVIGLSTLTGCFGQNQSAQSDQAGVAVAANAKSIESDQAVELGQIADQEELEEQAVNEEAQEEVQVDDQKRIKELIALGELMGKKQTDVAALLGKAEKTKNLEDTNILLADYYTQTILKQNVTVEVVYNDDKGEVNYITMTCKQADNVDSFVEAFINELTAEFGESSIEKITNVRGTRRREWQGNGLTYVLSYLEDTVTLDMYLTDK